MPVMKKTTKITWELTGESKCFCTCLYLSTEPSPHFILPSISCRIASPLEKEGLHRLPQRLMKESTELLAHL